MNTYEIIRLYDYNRETDMYESETNGGEFTAENDVVASFSFGVAWGKQHPKMKMVRAYINGSFFNAGNTVIGFEFINKSQIEYLFLRRK